MDIHIFYARFIGGFSGAKGWNQGYGYGQSGGYYGTNYDGSSKSPFCFLFTQKPIHSHISIDRASTQQLTFIRIVFSFFIFSPKHPFSATLCIDCAQF